MAELESDEFDCDASFVSRSNTADDICADERRRVAGFRGFYSCVPGIPRFLHNCEWVSECSISHSEFFFFFFKFEQTDPVAPSGSPPLLSLNGHADSFSLCTNTSANARLDVVFSPVTGHPHYDLDSCQPINIQVITH